MASWQSHPEILTFRDALGLALDLESHYRRGHFAVVIDPEGQVLQILARLPPTAHDQPGPPSRAHPSIELLDDPSSTAWHRGVAHHGALLVVSVDSDGIEPFGPAQWSAYHRQRQRLASRGITFVDWIQSDGDLYQSAAYTLHPDTAWLDDPMSERLAELQPGGPPGYLR